MSYRITSYLIISCHIVNYCYIWYHINCREIRLKSKLPAEHFAASFVGLPKVRIASPTPTTITITTTGQNLTFDLPCGSPPSVKSSTWTTSPHCRIESFRQPVMEGTWKPRFIRVIRVCEIVNKSFLCQTKKLCNKNIGHSRPGAGWPVGAVLEGLPGHRVWPESTVTSNDYSGMLWRFCLFSFQRVWLLRLWNGCLLQLHFLLFHIRFLSRPFFLEIMFLILYISHSWASLTGSQRRPLCNLLQSRNFSLSEHRLKASTKHES